MCKIISGNLLMNCFYNIVTKKTLFLKLIKKGIKKDRCHITSVLVARTGIEPVFRP